MFTAINAIRTYFSNQVPAVQQTPKFSAATISAANDFEKKYQDVREASYSSSDDARAAQETLRTQFADLYEKLAKEAGIDSNQTISLEPYADSRFYSTQKVIARPSLKINQFGRQVCFSPNYFRANKDSVILGSRTSSMSEGIIFAPAGTPEQGCRLVYGPGYDSESGYTPG